MLPFKGDFSAFLEWWIRKLDVRESAITFTVK